MLDWPRMPAPMMESGQPLKVLRKICCDGRQSYMKLNSLCPNRMDYTWR